MNVENEIDTAGFILVEAFNSNAESAMNADVVIDTADGFNG